MLHAQCYPLPATPFLLVFLVLTRIQNRCLLALIIIIVSCARHLIWLFGLYIIWSFGPCLLGAIAASSFPDSMHFFYQSKSYPWKNVSKELNPYATAKVVEVIMLIYVQDPTV